MIVTAGAEFHMAEIEQLRAERDDLLNANALLHALVGNREAEIERLRQVESRPLLEARLPRLASIVDKLVRYGNFTEDEWCHFDHRIVLFLTRM